MDWLLILILGFALSMDSLTVSIIISLTTKNIKLKELKLPIIFGISHALMIIVGYLLSTIVSKSIHQFNHWIAFFLLSFLGIRMMLEAKKKSKHVNWDTWKNSLLISLATSIDALTLGITFKLLEQNLISSSLIIGATVIILSYVGLIFGKKLHFLKPKYNYIIGGCVLIIIGLKILLEHSL